VKRFIGEVEAHIGRLARCYVDLGKREGVAIFLCRGWFLIAFLSYFVSDAHHLSVPEPGTSC